jgi:hypothetical protein
MNEGLKQDILDFYSDLNAPIATKKRPKEWEQVLKNLGALRNMPSASVASLN